LTDRPAVVVLAEAPRGRVHETLIARTLRWAETFGDATLVPPDEAAVREAAGSRAGPVIVVDADTPRLGDAHAMAALSDLRDGCDVTIGPANDGGWYLLGMREWRDDLLALPSDARDVFGTTLERAHAAGLSLGMLRSERRLRSEADARALLADPCAPRQVVEALRANGQPPR